MSHKNKIRFDPSMSPEERRNAVRATPAQLAKTMLDDAREMARVTRERRDAIATRVARHDAELQQGREFVAKWQARDDELTRLLAEARASLAYMDEQVTQAELAAARQRHVAAAESEEERLLRRLKAVERELRQLKGERVHDVVKARKFEGIPGL